MADQIINIGAAPNDGTGDPLRTAFSKTNNNFSELYTATGANSNSISVPVSAQVGGPTILLGSVNVGTATPTDLVNINGNPSSTVTGPTVRFTTNTDAYPLSQLFNYTHDNLAINFDSYNSSGSWFSGFSGSVYQITKASGLFSINYATNTTQGSAVTWNSGLVLSSYSVTLGNSNGSLLSFGGTTSSYPAIKRDGTGLQVRLADDSNNAPLSAGVFNIITPNTKATFGNDRQLPNWSYTTAVTNNSIVFDSTTAPGTDSSSFIQLLIQGQRSPNTGKIETITTGLSAAYIFISIVPSSLSAASAVSIPLAIGLQVASPIASTNVTMSSYALYASGSMRINGNIIAAIDNTYSVGGLATATQQLGRPLELHLTGNLKLWNGVSTTAGTAIKSNGDGIAQITNILGTDFGRLQFGGTTSSYPAIKRDGVGLQVRLADDTNTASLSSGIFSVITNSTKTTLGLDAINFPYTSVNNVTTNNAFFIDSQSSQTLPGVNTSSHYSYLFTSNGLPASPGLSATYAYMRIAPGALSAAAPTTIANTYGLVVVAPTAGTNVTITNPIYAIISSGSLNVAGTTVPNIDNNSGRTLGSSTLRWYEAHLSSNLKLWNGASTTTGLFMQSNGDGIAQMTNVAGTDFSQLQFGGTTSSYPSLKRDNTGLAVRLADDSGNASLSAGILTGLTSNGRVILGQDSVACPFINVANTTMNNAFITNWSTLPGTNQPIHSNYYFTSNTPTMAVVPNLSTTYTFMQIVPPTLSAASATNITNAYGLYVGAPGPGTNMALNNNYSIWCAGRIASTTMVPDLDNNSSRTLGFAATRWYDLFLSHSLKLTNSTSNATSNVFLTNGDGILSISNNAGTSFGRLQLGGTTSSYPAIKRDGAGIQIRLADDTGFAGLSAADIMANNVSLGSGGVLGNTIVGNGAGLIIPTYPTTVIGFQAGASGITVIGNTVVGYQSGNKITSGYSNTALGHKTLAAETTGSYNISIGYQAANSQNGVSRNIMIGALAGGAATQGGDNIAIGYASQSSSGSSGNISLGNYTLQNMLSTAGYNTVIGHQAAGGITSGGNNVAIGYQALITETTSSNNIAIGSSALKLQTGGGANNGNVAVGYFSLATLSAAQGDNTAIGYKSGQNGDFQRCTFVGSNAGTSLVNGLGNNTIIGYNAQASTTTIANEITLGNSSIATLRCQVTSITALSDKRDKSNIHPITGALKFISDLKPSWFDWNTRDGAKTNVKDSGFIAQDLQEVETKHFNIPGLVYDVNPGKLEASYGKLLPFMVKAIQELTEKCNALENRVKQLETK